MVTRPPSTNDCHVPHCHIIAWLGCPTRALRVPAATYPANPADTDDVVTIASVRGPKDRAVRRPTWLTQPPCFAPNLREQRYAQRPTVAGAGDSESIQPVSRPDLDGCHSLSRQQTLDAVAVRRGRTLR
jgi:hypothetical protein